MKITFITDEATQDPKLFVRLAKAHGLAALELRTVWDKHVADLSREERETLRSMLRDEGLSICCIGSPVFKCDLDDDLAAQFEKLLRCLDIASFFDAPLIRIFSFWRKPEQMDSLDHRMVTALRKAADLVKGNDVRLAIENGKRTMHSTGLELGKLMGVLDPEIFSVVWDPANSIFGGLDKQPVTCGYPFIAPHVRHVHIKDPYVDAAGRREYVRLGQGQLDIRSQLMALQKDNFQGFLSLETHWRPDRKLDEQDLDRPGGEDFSRSGLHATDDSLTQLKILVANALIDPGLQCSVLN